MFLSWSLFIFLDYTCSGSFPLFHSCQKTLLECLSVINKLSQTVASMVQQFWHILMNAIFIVKRIFGPFQIKHKFRFFFSVFAIFRLASKQTQWKWNLKIDSQQKMQILHQQMHFKNFCIKMKGIIEWFFTKSWMVKSERNGIKHP